MSLGAKKVATADGYTDSFPWNSGRQLLGMSDIESESDSLWSWLCEEGDKNSVAKIHPEEHGQKV